MEERITYTSRGYTVRGRAHVPQTERSAPVVVMCHGFTGNCSEHGLFDDFARQACEAGLYVLQTDCIGSGESDGDFAGNTCLGGWKQDIAEALNYAEGQKGTDRSRMAVLGISMGASAALLSLEDPRVRAVVGWAPVLYPADVFSEIMGSEKWALLGQGQEVHHSYAGVAFDAAPCLRRDAERFSVERVLFASDKPILLRFGSEDTVVSPVSVPRLRSRCHPNTRVQLIPNEDHSCSVHKWKTIQETIDFLCRNLA